MYKSKFSNLEPYQIQLELAALALYFSLWLVSTNQRKSKLIKKMTDNHQQAYPYKKVESQTSWFTFDNICPNSTFQIWNDPKINLNILYYCITNMQKDPNNWAVRVLHNLYVKKHILIKSKVLNSLNPKQCGIIRDSIKLKIYIISPSLFPFSLIP